MSPHDTAWGAIKSLSKPVTAESILIAVQAVLTPNDYAQFKSWFDQNSSYVIDRVNQ